jgi:hypothetical protein
MDNQRNIFEKEKFLKGNRQRWLVIFLICMFVILTLDATGHVQHVDSYLTFLTFLSGAFILGYSGTETMKLFTVNSSTQNINQHSKQETLIEEKLTYNTKEEGYQV